MSYLLGKYISDDGLKNIKNFKYKAGVYSKLDQQMNPFWLWCCEFLPRTMAPNTVTILGLGCLVGAYSSMVYFDISMTQQIPGWTHLAVAIGIFMFQTLDAIDGKQARRINCSSSLGQLFDHG